MAGVLNARSCTIGPEPAPWIVTWSNYSSGVYAPAGLINLHQLITFNKRASSSLSPKSSAAPRNDALGCWRVSPFEAGECICKTKAAPTRSPCQPRAPYIHLAFEECRPQSFLNTLSFVSLFCHDIVDILSRKCDYINSFS